MVNGPEDTILLSCVDNAPDEVRTRLRPGDILYKLNGTRIADEGMFNYRDLISAMRTKFTQRPLQVTFLRVESDRPELNFVPVSTGFHAGSPFSLDDMRYATREGKLSEKIEAFHGFLEDHIRVPYENGRKSVEVDRMNVFESAFQVMKTWRSSDWRKTTRFRFAQEEALDAGGVAREFWELLTKDIFDPARGLFIHAGTENVSYEINPEASDIDPDAHVKFRMVGALLAKAIMDRQHITAHLCTTLLAHIVGRPLSFDDLASQDTELHRNLSLTLQLDADTVEALDLTFTVDRRRDGKAVEEPLLDGGEDRVLTAENLMLYLELRFKERVFGRVSEFLAQFLIGWLTVITQKAMLAFTARELEFVLCGMPEISLGDWKKYTQYVGKYAQKGENDRRITWFWDIIEEWNYESRAKLLQFVTGTSRLPVQGFSALQGRDGNTQYFAISSCELYQSVFPRAHTCFNRIDLPLYKTASDMKQRLEEVLDVAGFTME